MKALAEFEVWFVTGSQDMYGDEALRQVALNARQVAESLDASPDIPVRIVHRPVVTSSESIVATCREANAADACVGVILWMHTFSPARMWTACSSPRRIIGMLRWRSTPWPPARTSTCKSR